MNTKVTQNNKKWSTFTSQPNHFIFMSEFNTNIAQNKITENDRLSQANQINSWNSTKLQKIREIVKRTGFTTNVSHGHCRDLTIIGQEDSPLFHARYFLIILKHIQWGTTRPPSYRSPPSEVERQREARLHIVLRADAQKLAPLSGLRNGRFTRTRIVRTHAKLCYLSGLGSKEPVSGL